MITREMIVRLMRNAAPEASDEDVEAAADRYIANEVRFREAMDRCGDAFEAFVLDELAKYRSGSP